MTFILRTLGYAVKDFWRNFWLSLITVTVIFIAVFSLNSLILIKTVSEYTIQTVEKKINVSVFINNGIEESVVLDLRSRLLGLAEVQEVIYISSEEALEALARRHQNDPAILESLEELDENPLGAQLIVQAKSSQDYEPIVALISDDRYSPIIAQKNFDEHTFIIERVSSISERVRSIATVLSLLFGLIAIIVVFNTLRVIIYTHREEISIMRLVGATNWFIRAPYLWQSLIYTVLALGAFLLIWYPILGMMQPYVDDLFADGSTIDLIAFFTSNFPALIGGQFVGMVVLLGIASIIATRKHSKI